MRLTLLLSAVAVLVAWQIFRDYQTQPTSSLFLFSSFVVGFVSSGLMVWVWTQAPRLNRWTPTFAANEFGIPILLNSLWFYVVGLKARDWMLTSFYADSLNQLAESSRFAIQSQAQFTIILGLVFVAPFAFRVFGHKPPLKQPKINTFP